MVPEPVYAGVGSGPGTEVADLHNLEEARMATELQIVSVRTGGWVDSEDQPPGRVEGEAQRSMHADLAALAELLEAGWVVESTLGMRDYGDEHGKYEVAKLLMRRDS